MNYTTKHSIGDRVFTMCRMDATRKIHCTTCNYTGKVMINNEEFDCPNCHGSCRTPQHSGHRWFISDEGIVGQVEICDSIKPYDADRKNPCIRYMIDTTGIGSGTNWYGELHGG
jgi:predicted RNA-binding Zn-ribbon protein involved in translation (DUF1610 family)